MEVAPPKLSDYAAPNASSAEPGKAKPKLSDFIEAKLQAPVAAKPQTPVGAAPKLSNYLGAKPQAAGAAPKLTDHLQPRAQGFTYFAQPEEPDAFHLSPEDIWNSFRENNMLLNFYHGAERIYNEIGTDPKKAANKFTSAAGDAVHAIANAKLPSLSDIVGEAKTAGGILKQIGISAWEHPKKTAGAILRTFTDDPELILADLFFGSGLAATGERIAAKLGGEATAIGRTLPKLTRALGTVTTDAAVNTAIEFSHQFKTGNYDKGQLVQAAEIGTMFGAGSATFKMLFPKKAKAKLSEGEMPEEPVSDTRYASDAEAKKAMREGGTLENIVTARNKRDAGRVNSRNRKTAKQRYWTNTAEGDVVDKFFMLTKEKPDRPDTMFVDLTIDEANKYMQGPGKSAKPKGKAKAKPEEAEPIKGKKKPASVFDSWPERFLFPKSEGERLSHQSGIDYKPENLVHQAMEKHSNVPEAIIPFMLKHAPKGIATAVIVGGLGIMLTDEPGENLWAGSGLVGAVAMGFGMLNSRRSGNIALTDAMAQHIGVTQNAIRTSHVFRQSATYMVGEEGLKKILRSYDNTLNIKLNAKEIFVKGAFEKNLFAIIRAARMNGIQDLKLFKGALPLKFRDAKGNSINLDLKKYETFKDLEEVLQTSDMEMTTASIADVLHYASTVIFKQMADKRLVEALGKYHEQALAKGIEKPEKLAINMKESGSDIIYKDYGKLPETTGYQNYQFHDSIRHALAAVVTPQGFRSGWAQAALGLASGMKRFEVQTSMFHAMTLYQATIGAMGLKGFAPREVMNRGYDAALGKSDNPVVRLLIKHGLTFGAAASDIDIEAMNSTVLKAAQFVDRFLPGEIAGKGAVKLETLNHTIDAFTFSFLQNSLKFGVGLAKFEELIGKGLQQEEAAKFAATFTNDIFGGQNWFRTMNSSLNHTVRVFGNKLITGEGLGWMRIIAFAPDWTFSTFRSAYKALPGVSEKELGSLYRRYLAKSAIIYAALGSAVSLALTGKTIFQSHDPLRVEIGQNNDGSPITMRLAKHQTEAFELLQDPRKRILSIISPLVKMPLETVTGVQYFGGPPISGPADTTAQRIGSYIKKFTEPLIPISLQGANDPVKTLAGVYGFPVYGKTDEEKAEAKQERKANRKASVAEARYHKGESRNARAVDAILEYLGIK